MDVCIVGAGLAGLTAAYRLRQRRLRVCVLEAHDRVGGRVFNHQLSSGGVVEAGGQWVGPTQTRIRALADELGLGFSPTYTDGKVVYRLPGISFKGTYAADEQATAPRLTALAGEVPADTPWAAPRAKAWDSVDARTGLLRAGFSKSQVNDLAASLGAAFGAPLDKLSFLFFLHYLSSAGGFEAIDHLEGGAQQDRFTKGSGALAERLAQAVAGVVHVSEPVCGVSGWDGAVVAVSTPTRTVSARKVILALSPALLRDMVFVPRLPSAKRALFDDWNADQAGAVKINVVYDRPFWRSEGLNGISYAFPGDGLAWTIDNSPYRHRAGALAVFADMADLPADATGRSKFVLDALARRFGKRARSPVQYLEEDWGTRAWTRGCVPAVQPGRFLSIARQLRPATGRLHWAGTETSAVWTGYMEGAVRSGERVADEIRC